MWWEKGFQNGYTRRSEAAPVVQGRKLRKSIADMQSSHKAQVAAVMDKYNSLRTKVCSEPFPKREW